MGVVRDLSFYQVRASRMRTELPQLADAGYRARLSLSDIRRRAREVVRPRPPASVRLAPQRVIALHYPKAGGYSLRTQFEQLLGRDLALDYGHDPLIYRARAPVRFPRDRQMVIGHFHASRYDDPDAFRFTFLREPVANLISNYYFWRCLADHGHPLHRKFLRERPGLCEFAQHPQIRTMMSDGYFGGVDMARFDFIGFHETRQADIGRLSAMLGIGLSTELHVNRTPPSAERAALTDQPGVTRRLTDLLARDVAFYWRVRQQRS